MKWFIKSTGLYWSEERGDWGPKDRATAYDHRHTEMPLAMDPQWVEEQPIRRSRGYALDLGRFLTAIVVARHHEHLRDAA